MKIFINEKIILPLNDLIFGTNIANYFKFVLQSQWWSKEQFEEYQNTKLKQLIKHAYTNVPYYRELFKNIGLTPDDIKTKEDLPKIPFLTKEIIKKNFPDRLVAENYKNKKLLLSKTGGSTGQPMYYYQHKRESYSINLACNIRAWYWMGYRLGMPFIKLSIYERKSRYKRIQDRVTGGKNIKFNNNYEYIINTIKQKKIKFLRGYPSMLYLIAGYMEQNNIDDIYLNGVTTTSEPCHDFFREKIEKMFHCKLMDVYGAEGAPVISQCEYCKLYHIGIEKSIVEFIRNDINVNDGIAEMVFTDLYNYATPLIRYRSKDLATLTNETCECGRNLPVIEKIGGRDLDILVTPGGKLLTFHWFDDLGYFFDFLDLFQIYQHSITEFILNIVPNEKFKPEHKDVLHKEVLNYINDPQIKLEIKIVDDIPLTQSGKLRLCVRNPEIKLPF